jgi:tetraacyldisaccharide 4'-kinase
MRAPEFWNHKYGRDAALFLRTILRPLGALYAHSTAKRIANTTPYDPGIPVICVGNASVGGTGKTPIVAYLLESFNRMGIRAVALSRGYGGREKGPVLVHPKHTYRDVGDEPILLSRSGPVWIAAGRDDGARAARGRGAQTIIMDDGHQNPLLQKTLSLLVVDAEIGFGNELIFPAGPLREPIKAALARTDAVVLMKPTLDYQPGDELLEHLHGTLVLNATLRPKQDPPAGKLFAFAGIGRPNKFFDALIRSGAELVEGLDFADHHAYKDTDMKNLIDMAYEYKAQLITTEKDYVRIPTSWQKNVLVWPVSVQFEDELAVRRILHPLIEKLKKPA